jgi:hypothetical protein
MFAAFHPVTIRPFLTRSDLGRLPGWMFHFVPEQWGWYIAVRAIKENDD